MNDYDVADRSDESSDSVLSSALSSAGHTVFAVSGQIQNDKLAQYLSRYSANLEQALTTTKGQLSVQTLSVQQGFISEAHHAASYNIEASVNGVQHLRASTDAVSAIDPVTDVRITSRDTGASVDYQMKFFKNPEDTARAFSKARYTGQDVGKVAPAEQVAETVKQARRQALRNRDIRPEISKDYQHTADRVSDHISHPDRVDIRSRALSRKGKGGSEDLARQVQRGDRPEYAHAREAQAILQNRQYWNAAKNGALAGALIPVGVELMTLFRRNRSMSVDDCERVARNVVLGAAKGAGTAMLTTGVQHVGKTLVRGGASSTAKAIGIQLGKGNIAANTSILITQLAGDLYRFSKGEVDGIELAESTLNNGISLAASAAGYTVGVSASALIGPMISSAVAETAVMGTTLGTLGPIGLGIGAGIAASLAVSSYISYFSVKGQKLAVADILASGELLQQGDISLATYCGQVGVMSEFTFSWSDILPLSGSFSVLGEYKARKRQLMQIQQDIAKCRADLPEQEVRAMLAIEASYQQKLTEIEQAYQQQQAELNARAQAGMNQLQDDLDNQLQLHFALHHDVCKAHLIELARGNAGIQSKQRQQQRLVNYTDELNSLGEQLRADTSLSGKERGLLQGILKARTFDILPPLTPFDQAEIFFLGEIHAV